MKQDTYDLTLDSQLSRIDDKKNVRPKHSQCDYFNAFFLIGKCHNAYTVNTEGNERKSYEIIKM